MEPQLKAAIPLVRSNESNLCINMKQRDLSPRTMNATNAIASFFPPNYWPHTTKTRIPYSNVTTVRTLSGHSKSGIKTKPDTSRTIATPVTGLSIHRKPWSTTRGIGMTSIAIIADNTLLILSSEINTNISRTSAACVIVHIPIQRRYSDTRTLATPLIH